MQSLPGEIEKLQEEISTKIESSKNAVDSEINKKKAEFRGATGYSSRTPEELAFLNQELDEFAEKEKLEFDQQADKANQGISANQASNEAKDLAK